MKSATELNVEVMELRSRNLKLIQSIGQKNKIIEGLKGLIILAESRMEDAIIKLKAVKEKQ